MNRFWRYRALRVGLGALIAAIILHLVLIQPNHPDALAWDALLLIPLEWPAIVLGLVAMGQNRANLFCRVALVAVLTLIAVLKFADYVMFESLTRGFNPVSDLPLVGSLYDLIIGAFGQVAATAALAGFVLALLALITGLWWACRFWARLQRPGWVAGIAGIAAAASAIIVVADVGQKMGRWSLPYTVPATAFTARVGVERVEMAQETLADLRAFRIAARQDPFANQPNLFDLVDRDVFVIFVESYGRTSLDTPFYADLHRTTLLTAQQRFDDLGLSMASTLLRSPTQGGQSWLAHSTFANGLWIDNQTAYGAAITSGRKTLFHLAAEAGFHTAAVMPQITLEWPEAQFMGFDTILAAGDLEYKGLPLNWVTMPDQFTFAAMDRLLPGKAPADTPLFVQMALGSSHAPWVPVPTLMEWDALGDGSVFNELMETSDPPSVVWKVRDRVRAQYRLAVDYALQVVFDYVALHAEDPPLMLIVGDHQAAGFIALDERPHVPMHIVGPAHLVDAIKDSDFATGLIPGADAPVRSMADMRAHLLTALSTSRLAEAVE